MTRGYVVTVTRPCMRGSQFCEGAACPSCEGLTGQEVVSRQEVDTLEEAVEKAGYLVNRLATDAGHSGGSRWADAWHVVTASDEDGCKVELPGGSTISVERVEDDGLDAAFDDDEPCSECGASTADGEGYDGLCGTCADVAEKAGRWDDGVEDGGASC